MKQIIFILVLLQLFSNDSAAQPTLTITGDVSSTNHIKLPNCSVFINRSSKGTISNTNGEFVLSNIPMGTHELIVSCVGYETYTLVFTDSQLPLTLHINLTLKPTELSAVEVKSYQEGSWEQWGKIFTQNFIGTYGNARDCRIRNPEVIRFRYYQRDNQLLADADEPLVIVNDALGYLIKYQLEQFYFDLDQSTVLFKGYPLFQEMTTKKPSVRSKWASERKKAYLGSLMHIMRSLYNNDLLQQGFEIHKITKIPDPGKENAYDVALKAGVLSEAHILKQDSSHYYRNTTTQPDYFKAADSSLVTADSLLVANPDGTKSLFFTDKLLVVYKDAKEDYGYLRTILSMRRPNHQKSIIYLRTPTPVLIWRDGNFYSPDEIFSKGYLAWLGKLANALPWDYDIDDKKD